MSVIKRKRSIYQSIKKEIKNFLEKLIGQITQK